MASPTIWHKVPNGRTHTNVCAIYALQRHVGDTSESNSHLVDCAVQLFYVDNCLRRTHSKEEAKDLVDGLLQLIHTGGFEICQWTSNVPAVIEHLPPMSEERAVSYGFLSLAWTFRSQLLSYNGLPGNGRFRTSDSAMSSRDLHIFCNASERAYGSVAYVWTEDTQEEGRDPESYGSE